MISLYQPGVQELGHHTAFHYRYAVFPLKMLKPSPTKNFLISLFCAQSPARLSKTIYSHIPI